MAASDARQGSAVVAHLRALLGTLKASMLSAWVLAVSQLALQREKFAGMWIVWLRAPN
jgi:hypothetical protein